ncbi:MAG: hypothetical protein OXB84_05500 [Halobacteriovoraceae bacterium]|nr:hypothetical protein [Halobacteriovoraceae bacterium]
MNNNILFSLENKVISLFKEIFENPDYMERLNKMEKNDRSLVTSLDIKISNEFKSFFKKHDSFKGFNFLSEEDQIDLLFPSIILDPIDGTKEMSMGIPECAVSLAIMNSSKIDGEAWIFNPFTGLNISSNQKNVHSPSTNKFNLTGLISRSEAQKGMLKKYNRKKINLIAKGSIAYKLGLLAVGACDFVISKKDKNIWDIAGGTIICKKRGINCFVDGKKISNLESERYKGPILWCRDSDFSFIESAVYFS